MNKWLNRQKPITLGFITALCSTVVCSSFNYFLEEGVHFNFLVVIFLISFFLSWLLFYTVEKSQRIFEEIDKLNFRAKKVKTKTELTTIIKEYNNLRERADNQGHYAQLNIIKGILETKKEFI